MIRTTRQVFSPFDRTPRESLREAASISTDEQITPADVRDLMRGAVHTY
jgi:hypothetical protein